METMETSIGLTFRRIRTPQEAIYPDAERIFRDSFPLSERRPLSSLHRLMTDEERFYFVAVSTGEITGAGSTVAGILAYWDFSDFLYVEYLATRSDLRGRSLGRKIMETLFAEISLPVVLEAEPAGDELSARRIRFYERLGFTVEPDAYQQPSYGVVPGIPLKILRRSGVCGDHKEKRIPTQDIIRILHREVYGVADYSEDLSRRRLLPSGAPE